MTEASLNPISATIVEPKKFKSMTRGAVHNHTRKSSKPRESSEHHRARNNS